MNGVQVSHFPLLGPVDYGVFPDAHLKEADADPHSHRYQPHPSMECLASEGQRAPGPQWGSDGVHPLLGRPHCPVLSPCRAPGPSSWPILLRQAKCPHTLGYCPRRFQGSGLRDETLYE